MADEPKITDEKPADEKPTRHKRDRKESADVVDRLVSRHGTERAALSVLADENLDYRETIRDLKANGLKDGERKLSADEAKEFDAFKAIGKSPQDLTAALTERDTFATENAAMKGDLTATEAAKLIGSEKPAVLARILKAEGYRLELADETDDDGAPTKVAYAVKGEGERAELSALLTTTLSDYRPALLTEQPQTQRTTSATGAPIPPQPPKGTAPAPKQKSIEQLKDEKRQTGAYSA